MSIIAKSLARWRRTRRNAGFFVLLLLPILSVCSDNSPTEVDDGSLESQIRALFPAGTSRDDALSRLATIRQQVAANSTATAQSQALSLIDVTLKSFNAGQLTGATSMATGNSVANLVRGIYQLVGLDPPQIPDNSLGGDGTAQVVGPAGATVVTPAGIAGVVIPPNALPQQTLVTINRLASPPTPGTGPLTTTLKQYPPYYDVATYPATQLSDSVRVGVCQVTDPSNPLYPPEPHERLRLGHGVGASVEILDRVDVTDFLRCTGVSPDRKVAGGVIGFLASLGEKVISVVRPSIAYAAHGGLGGKVKSFSPFGAVDPGAPTLTSRLVGAASGFCALDASSAAYCWGDPITAGTGTPTGPVTSPQRVQTSLAFSALTGDVDVCGLTSTGDLYCWGDNGNGQYGLGTADTVWSFTPRRSAPPLSFSWVSAGGAHECGITFSAATYCWGENVAGSIGNGNLADFITTPVRVVNAPVFTTVSAGAAHTCGLTAAGAAYCWGFNANGALGNGSTSDAATPVAVSGGLVFKKIVAAFFFTCGIATDGTYCWGRNRFGQVGSNTGVCPNEGGPTALCPTAVPTKVATSQTFVDIFALDRSVCALTATGAAYCWGDNAFGNLGNGTTNNNPTPSPTAVSGGLTFTTMAAGQWGACGATSDGSIYCWGRNQSGQVGQGTATGFYTTPQLVNGIKLK